MLYNLLYDYQKKTVDDLKDFDSCGLFYDVGCGKFFSPLSWNNCLKDQTNNL